MPHTIASVAALAEGWTPLMVYQCVANSGTSYYWSRQAVTWGGQPYTAIVLDHDALKIDMGALGVPQTPEIRLALNNADTNLNAIVTQANFQGAIITPYLILVEPYTGEVTTDSICFGKFVCDAPSATYPVVQFSAWNKLNFARKLLPLSTITRYDRYPFPDTAGERDDAYNDPSSPFYALGYSPENGQGNYKTGVTPYTAAEYNGTRDVDGTDGTVCLDTIGLGARFGGFGKVPPPTVSVYMGKGQDRQDFKGTVNEGKYGQAVPLLFGTVRIAPIVLDTGSFASSAARLSHLLLGDGVNYAPSTANMGIGSVREVILPNAKDGKDYRLPASSSDPGTTGSYALYAGFYGSQVPNVTAYRNIIPATDLPGNDFQDRDLYSGLAFLAIGYPKELAELSSDKGPNTEVIVDGLKIETWDVGINKTWAWTSNPVWIYWHLLKLLGWDQADIDTAVAYASAAYSDAALANGLARFRCNLPLTQREPAEDILRGIRGNCRLYTTYGSDGKLQLKIQKTFAAEGSSFALGPTNILRDSNGQLCVKKYSKSVLELANIYGIDFQNEDREYVQDHLDRKDIDSINLIGQVDGGSITSIRGIPSIDQATRALNWVKTENVDANEWYQVRCSLAAIQLAVGMVGTITDTQHGLSAVQCRLRSYQPNPDGTVDLVLQKHLDAAYSDAIVTEPLLRASSDSSYSPRSVGPLTATELFTQDDTNREQYHRKIKVSFPVPATAFVSAFANRTYIRDLVVATTGGSIAGNQKVFIEIAPHSTGEGLASNYVLANIPAGTNTNKITFTLEIPEEAAYYRIRVGTYPGKLYLLSHTAAPSPWTGTVSVTITDITTGLDQTSLSVDPRFDHVRFFYRYGSTGELQDAGATSGPTETDFIFEPESPGATDTQITIIASSVNAAESDFYPLDAAPSATVTLTKDSGNPTGCTGLVILTHADDATVPEGCMVFQFNRDTANFKSIFAVEVCLYLTATAEGPYAAQRAAHAARVHATGAGLAITAGERNIVVTTGYSCAGKVFLIYGVGDAGLDGNIVESYAANAIVMTKAFQKSGTFNWAIVDRWWDPTESGNKWEHTFWVPIDMLQCGDEAVWRTKPVPLLDGIYYANVYTRNMFGVSV